MNLGRFVRATAELQPEREALVTPAKRLTYLELNDMSDRLAHAFTHQFGLTKGDRVGVLGWNSAELVVTEIACYKAGLVRVPINARLGATEVSHLIEESSASVVVAGASHIDLLAQCPEVAQLNAVVTIDGESPWGPSFTAALAAADTEPVDVEVGPEDLAVLHFTSGSTGKLKAARQSYGNRLTLIRKSLMHPDGYVGPGKRQLLAGPITHASGMPLMGIFRAGGTAIVLQGWDPEQFLETIELERATHAFLVPTMISSVLAVPSFGQYDLSSLEHLLYGGAPISSAKIREAWSRIGPVLAQAFGCGETTSAVLYLSNADHARAIEGGDDELLLSCGRASLEAEIRIVDDAGNTVARGEVGELAVRGPDVVSGYDREPELTQESFVDGWFHTGDLARQREDGFVFIVDRKKDMIVSGGFNIYSLEVENVLARHPDVADVAVVGVPDDRWGEAVKAVVVPRPGATPGEAELIAFCGEHLSSMKKPQSVDLVSHLPVNQNGKVDRKSIRAQYWGDMQRLVN